MVTILLLVQRVYGQLIARARITLDMIGEYHVWVEGLTGIFMVGTWPPEPPLKPAEFVVSDLSIEPEEVELGGGG